MFSGFGNVASLIKQYQQVKENWAKIQEQLAGRTFEAEAGAGLVKAVVNAKNELVDIKIDASATQDLELLEDLVKGAVSEAARKAQQNVKDEVAKLTGGMNLPGLDEMLGGAAPQT